MKTGMNLLLWTGHVTEEHYPIMKDIKAAGFDGVEIPVFDTTVDHYKKVRKELDNLGLKCTTVTIVSPEANPISPDANVRKAAVELLKKAIDCNQALGAESCAASSGGRMKRSRATAVTRGPTSWRTEEKRIRRRAAAVIPL